MSCLISKTSQDYSAGVPGLEGLRLSVESFAQKTVRGERE